MEPLTIEVNWALPGLFAAITAAGHVVEHVNGDSFADDAAAVQAIVDAYSLDQAKAHVCGQVIALATDYFNKAVASFSPGELAGWPILRAEALAYQADPTAATPNIADEAGHRGCTVAALVQRVLANTAFYDAARALIAGTSGRHRDAINQLGAFEDVAAYDYSTGWPGA